MSNPHDYLPTELWELISKYLKNPHDLKNLSEVSLYFFYLLQPKRSQFLLQLVLPIVADYKSTHYAYYGRHHKLLLNDLLNFRLASKSCNQSVLYYFQQHLHQDRCFTDESSSPAPYSPPYCHARDIRLFVNVYSFRRIATLLDAAQLNHPTSKYANPVVSRFVVLSTFMSASLAQNGIDQEIMGTATKLLELYGKHLLRLTFIFRTGTTIPIEQQYWILTEWLSLVPNLNSLTVNFCCGDGDVRFSQRDFTIQQNVIEVNPLPQLPHLSKLATKYCPSQIQQAVLRAYYHVESLSLEFPDDINSEDFKEVHWLLNLKKLAFTIRTKNDLKALDNCLGSEQPWPRLQTLEMDLANSWTGYPTSPAPKWVTIISFLNRNFGGAQSLVNLFISAPYSSSTRDSVLTLENTQRCRLKLRQVEQLKLCMSELFLLDFILPMKNSLKKLTVWNVYGNVMDRAALPVNQEVNYRQKIAWNGWLGKSLLASNIWTTFRNLTFIRVENRRGWIYRRRLGCSPVYIYPNGRAAEFDENVSEDEGEGDLEEFMDESDNDDINDWNVDDED